jgi:AcrR family transcriptional regulator
LSTREQLVAATSLILKRDGLARLSTRLVAKEAGVSEGALYKHFATKEALLLAAVEALVAPYTAVTYELPTRIGLGRVEDTLRELVLSNYYFMLEVGPIWGSLHADPQLHQRYLDLMRERDHGPHHTMDLLARYLAAEQRLGRVHASPRPEAIADLLMAIAHFHASLDRGIGRDPEGALERVKSTLDAAFAGILPRPEIN